MEVEYFLKIKEDLNNMINILLKNYFKDKNYDISKAPIWTDEIGNLIIQNINKNIKNSNLYPVVPSLEKEINL